MRKLTHEEEKRVLAYMDMTEAIIKRTNKDGRQIWLMDTPEADYWYLTTDELMEDINFSMDQMFNDLDIEAIKKTL